MAAITTTARLQWHKCKLTGKSIASSKVVIENDNDPVVVVAAGTNAPPQVPEVTTRFSHFQCNVSKVQPLVSTSTSIREARIEDFWQVADTHCGVFMPDQGILMDFALRFDRVMALIGNTTFASGSLQKKCLVAVEQEEYPVPESDLLMRTLVPSSHISGVLTIDNIGEFLPRRKPSGRRRTGIAYVSNVAVRPERRRLGIARKLLRSSEELAKSWGCRSVALHCATENAAAVELYMNEGYKIIRLAQTANWPRPKGLPGSKYLLLMKGLRRTMSRGLCAALRAMIVSTPAQCRSYATSSSKQVEDCRTSMRRFSFGNAVAVDIPRRCSPGGVRRFWVAVPVQMGRRACKIAARKGAQAAKKMKVRQKIGKLISKAVRDGGPNPTSNLALATLLQHAKEHNFPKDIIDKKLKKAGDKDAQDYTECTYEAYGFGGVGIVMEVLTDKPARANQSIRDAVRRSGAKMADPGSVMFGFKRAGVVAVKASQISSDDLLLAAMDAGAEDVIEPETYEDEDPFEEKYFKVVMPVEQYGVVNTKLREAGIPVDIENSGLELIPLSTVEPDDEAVELNKNLVEKLMELDDVDAVYTSQK